MSKSQKQGAGFYKEKQKQDQKDGQEKENRPGAFYKRPIIFCCKITEPLMRKGDFNSCLHQPHSQKKAQDPIACLKDQQTSQIIPYRLPCMPQNFFHKSAPSFLCK